MNHNGDIAVAKRLIDAAKDAGADAVKFQTWITELIVTEDSASADYQQQNTGKQSQYELLKALELSHDQFIQLKDYAHQVGIWFLSTPDEEVSAEFLLSNGMELIKVGSGELTNLPFLDFLARKRLPMIVSTGMATMQEVESAVTTIQEAGTIDLSLLHCVSNYPADPADCNLRAMATMRKEFGLPVGYSDHTMGNEICLAAVALGATIIEKHLTLDRTMDGPDHGCSSEPAEFAELVKGIRDIESAMGDGVKQPVSCELATRKVVRKEIVAKRDMRIGEILQISDLTLKRGNGEGLGSDQFENVIGKCVIEAIPENALVLPSKLSVT